MYISPPLSGDETASEFLELFLGGAGRLRHLEDVEPDRLAERATFADCRNVSNMSIPKAGREVDRHGLVPLLESVVLCDVVKIVPPDDDRPLHLHLGDDSGQDPAADVDVAGERAFLVDVVTVAGLKEENLE